MKVAGWILNLVGIGLFTFGMFGIADADRHLRRQVRTQAAIIDHYEAGQGPEFRASDEEYLERLRNRKTFYSSSVVVNVFSLLAGVGIMVASGRWVYGRGKRAA